MVLFEFVFDGVRGRIAAEPEGLDELLTLLVGLQSLERGFLFVGDDVGNIFVKPLSQGPVSFFLRPRSAVLLLFGFLLLHFLLFGFGLFLRGNRKGRGQKNQGRQGNNNPPTAHKRTSIRVVSIASTNDLVS